MFSGSKPSPVGIWGMFSGSKPSPGRPPKPPAAPVSVPAVAVAACVPLMHKVKLSPSAMAGSE